MGPSRMYRRTPPESRVSGPVDEALAGSARAVRGVVSPLPIQRFGPAGFAAVRDQAGSPADAIGDEHGVRVEWLA